MSHDGMQDAQETEDGLPLPIPAMPAVPSSQLNRGRPWLPVESGLRHSLGWQDHRKSGPSFVVVRLRPLDRAEVISRFPLTDQGWESAWRSLSSLDPGAAAAVGAKLATMQERRRAGEALQELNADTVGRLRMTYNGGSGDPTLTRGQAYDLRFLADRLMICRPRLSTAVVELPYDDVETLEVSGHGKSGQPVAVIVALALGGALLGLILFGLLGLFLGAALGGLIGAVATSSSAKVETTVRLRSRDAEFFFMNAEVAPEAVRIELSGPLTAIARARTAGQSGSGEPAQRASDSIPDQLSKLASLLADGVLSREEFEHFKAKLMAEP